MAFCNSCGATVDAGTKFCNKCGAAVSTVAPASAAATPAAGTQPPQGGGSALKIILIIVVVIVGLGVVGFGTVAFLIHRAVSRVHDREGNMKIHSPFGNVQTTTDPDEAAQNLGVAFYPGAEIRKGSAADVSFGSMHTSKVVLETDDAPDKVADFYRSQMPDANFLPPQGDRYSIVKGGPGDMTTVSIHPEDGRTRIDIGRVVTAH